jgi:hypothetical protein
LPRLGLVLGIGTAALTGCVAQIGEQRLVGPPRPIAESRSESLWERDEGADPAAPPRCRNVVVTSPLVRDVTVRRYFVGEGQNVDLALSALIGTAVALIAYGADQAGCSDGGKCHDVARLNGPLIALGALAIVPIVFAGYNAVRVQDTQRTEFALPEVVPGPWVSCEPPTASAPASPVPAP